MRPTMPALIWSKGVLGALPNEYREQINRLHRRSWRPSTRPMTAQVRSMILDLRLVQRAHPAETVLALLSIARPLTPAEQIRLAGAKTAIFRIMDWSQ